MALSGGSQGLILKRINESKGGGEWSSWCCFFEEEEVPKLQIGMWKFWRRKTGTQDPFLPFLASLPLCALSSPFTRKPFKTAFSTQACRGWRLGSW